MVQNTPYSDSSTIIPATYVRVDEVGLQYLVDVLFAATRNRTIRNARTMYSGSIQHAALPFS
jgi:hypothetical protein